MSLPQPPTRQPTNPESERYTQAVHTAAIACVIIAPVLALLPPRKLDIYTLGLGGLTVYSANHLYRDSHAGRNLWQRASWAAENNATLPTERAREFQKRYKARLEAESNHPPRMSILEKTWYGAEDRKDWKQKREKEVREKLAEGKGYGDIIMDQIWEVWNWGASERGRDGDEKGSERDSE